MILDNKRAAPRNFAGVVGCGDRALPLDRAEMKSTSSAEHGATLPNGQNFETHWYQNDVLKKITEIKTKLDGH